MLLFHQRRKVADAAGDAGGGAAGKGKSASRTHALAAPVGMGEDEISVEDLVQEALHQSDRKLRILKENDLKEALEEYVQKQQANAINELVANVLEDTQQKLNSAQYRTVTTAALIAEAVDDMAPTQTQGTPFQAPQAARPPTRQPPPPVHESAQQLESEDEASDPGEARTSSSKAAAASSSRKAPSPKRGAVGKRARSSRAAAAEDEDSEDNDDEKDDEFHVRLVCSF